MITLNIKDRYDIVLELMKDLQVELLKIQEECPHEHVHKLHRADTGNYDPSQDEYWVQCRCLDCGKVWREDQ